ncbi:hypothetical protein D3C73_1577810 [compost metagenome]
MAQCQPKEPVGVAEPVLDIPRTAGEGAESNAASGNLERRHPVIDAFVPVVHRA